MENMYGDKNGACAVIGALHGTLETKPKLNIIFVELKIVLLKLNI